MSLRKLGKNSQSDIFGTDRDDSPGKAIDDKSRVDD
jgi:hypothetical protein